MGKYMQIRAAASNEGKKGDSRLLLNAAFANNIHGKLQSFFSRIYYSRAATQK